MNLGQPRPVAADEVDPFFYSHSSRYFETQQAAGQPWFRGGYTVRGNQLYVNRGLGFGKGTRLPRIN